MALSKKDILLGLPIEDVVQRTENNFVQVFNELEDEVGYTIGLSVDPSSYEMTLELKNSVGVTISTASVDLPIESLVLSASYANGILTLQLQSGQTLDVDISSLISGLVPDSRTINGKNLKSNVTLTQDDVGDGTSYVRFTPKEKEKLKNIATGANNYQPPTYTGLPTAKGLYKIKVNTNGDVVEATAVAKSDITALGIAGNENATTSNAGLMSAADKTKLEGIETGANKYVLPNAGTTLGGVKTGGDVTIQNGVITVTSVGGKTADEIGKVKDVTVNGASVLNETTGVAAITIESLKSGYVNVSASSLVNCEVGGTNYKAIKVADTDTPLEVYNYPAGNKILTHTVRKDGNLYICVGTTAIECTLRKVGGNSIGTMYRHNLSWHSSDNDSFYWCATIISSRANSYDVSSLGEFLQECGCSFESIGTSEKNKKHYPVSGYYYYSNTYYTPKGLFYDTDTNGVRCEYTGNGYGDATNMVDTVTTV